MNITVYLGANEGNDPALRQAVEELGRWIGMSGHRLVYGGSKTGLMGALARGVLEAGGQVIGVGAGQQSRIHCTRLAGNKADVWYLRQHKKVLELPFKEKIRRADRDNTIDVYISDDYMDVLADGVWEQFFTEKPEPLTREEKRAWLDTMSGVSLGSDAFFPFGDNIERAHKSGVEYIAQPGGSIRDDNVIDTCNKYGIAMAFTGIRLFHH